MLQYAICEISGKQYRIIGGKPIEVDYTGEPAKNIEVKVLLLNEDGKLKTGKPYLKETLSLTNLGTFKSNKIRVSKFHAKANYRRVIGSATHKLKVSLDVKKAS